MTPRLEGGCLDGRSQVAEDIEAIVLRIAEAAGLLDRIVAVEPLRDSDGRIVDLRIVYLNHAARAGLPEPFADPVGRTWRELLPSDIFNERFGRWAHLLEVGGSLEVRALFGERSSFGGHWPIDARGVAEGDLLVLAGQATSERTSRERERLQAETLYRRLLEVADEGILVVDAAGIVTFVNSSVARMFGMHRDQILGRKAVEALGHATPPGRYEMQIARPDGTKANLLVSSTPLYDADGGLHYSITVVTDITETRRNEERYRLLAENSTDVVTVRNVDGIFTYVSPSAMEVFGYSVDEVVGHSAAEFLEPDDRASFLEQNSRLDELPDVFTFLARWRRKDGLSVWVETTARQVRDPVSGEAVEIVSACRDATARVRALEELEASEARFRHRAGHDTLTGLPNRDLLFDRLGQALTRARRSGVSIAVLFVDIDKFKDINDSLGHDFGDRLLVEVGRRIIAGAREADTVARFGGDEYVVVCEGVTEATQAVSVAERISAQMRAGFEMSGQRLRVTVSIGIVVSSDDLSDENGLLRNADVAMYRAKQRGRDRCELFDAALSAESRRRLKIGTDLRDAMDDWQFQLHYQPIVNLMSGRVTGCEALLRWQHPTRGLLYPRHFLDIAEDSGVIIRIGARVLLDACLQAARWMHIRRESPLTVAINVSLHQLAWSDFQGDLDHALRTSGLDPALLHLELTETALLDAAATAQIDLSELVRRGITIGIDDFGTGYSSLAYLKQSPVGFLKIDKAFVDGLGSELGDAAIVDAIVTLGRALSLDTVGEGVESAAQLAALRNAGCTLAQGYFLGRPAPAEAMEAMMARTF